MRRKCVPKAQKAERRILLLLCSLVLIGYLAFLADRQIAPSAADYAQFECRRIANNAIGQAVSDVLEQTPDFADSLYSIEYDSSGNAAAIFTDSGRINRARMLLSERAAYHLTLLAQKNYSVALGTLTENYLFVGRGPHVTLRIQPQSYLKSEVFSGIESVGINQTRLSIRVEFCAEMNTTLGTYHCQTTITNAVPLAEVIFVGETPKFYSE